MPGLEKNASAQENGPILAVRIRGTVGDNAGTELTMKSLGMPYKFNARILPSGPQTLGMLRRAKELVTWGELEPETLKLMLMKRADIDHSTQHGLDDGFAKSNFNAPSVGDLAKSIISGETVLKQLWKAGVRPTFRFHPPKGGFKRSSRRPYNSHGELGYRGRDINRLARRMV